MIQLCGCAVSEYNARLLVTAMLSDGSPDALAAAEVISSGLAHHDLATMLTPEMRDSVLLSIGDDPVRNGLLALKRELDLDQRARR